MILTKDSNDNWSTVAAGAGTWRGTKAAWEAGVSGGTIPANTVGLITDDAVGADITEITPTFTVMSDPILNEFYSKAWIDNRTGMVTVYAFIDITNVNEWHDGHVSLGRIHGIPCVKGTDINGHVYVPIPMYKSGTGRAINGFFNGCYGHADIGDIGFKFLSTQIFSPNTQNVFNCYFTYMGDLDHYIA